MADEVANYVRIVVRKDGDEDQIKKFAADARTIEKNWNGVFDIQTLAGLAGGKELEEETPALVGTYNYKGNYQYGEGIAPQLVNGTYKHAIAYDFTTKWRPPLVAIEPIGKMYPDLIFEWEFYELSTEISGKVIYCDALGVNQRLDWAEYETSDEEGEPVEDEFFSPHTTDPDIEGMYLWHDDAASLQVMLKTTHHLLESNKKKAQEIEELKAGIEELKAKLA